MLFRARNFCLCTANCCLYLGVILGVEPGYYKAEIIGDSIHMEYITQDEYNKNKSNPQDDNVKNSVYR